MTSLTWAEAAYLFAPLLFSATVWAAAVVLCRRLR